MRFALDAEQMADRVAELGPVERVEMEVADAAGIELTAELGGDGRGDQLPRGRQIVEPFEQLVEPLRNACAASSARSARGRATLETGRMPGTISTSIPAAAASSRKRKKQSAEKKNCVIARSAPGVDLALQIFEIERARGRIRVNFRIGRDRNVERRDRLQAGDEIGGIAIAVRDAADTSRRARAGRRAARRCCERRAPNIRARPRRLPRASRRRR